MTNPALKMSPQERQQRSAEKRAAVLGFLASGEQWSTLTVLSELLRTSERNALRLLQKLNEEKLIKVDDRVLPHLRLKLYGITDHGLAVVGADVDMKAFAIGRTNPSFVQHHLESQLVRIRAEQTGWSNWTPGKVLFTDNSTRLKKLPDSLANRPDGRRVAVEIERFVKSPKRLTDVVGLHLQQIVAGKYDLVYYFTPHPEAQMRAFNKIQFVTMENQKVKLNDSHRARFKVFNLSEWKGEM
ncbi:hypothetical protein MIZ01_1595 [Sideroxyarcus emersonii]|uniref:Mobilization protein n=1 Tax=Sideroxyarcus emersonii TaxID=2764705 RepID=A0AAN1XAM2_9PROT|nr:hypothetical protein [Sideroxyarcus emersonii]BCK87799.1 hypothetical protein MIZ01_1595 [Sideroxyarcus emersonii]